MLCLASLVDTDFVSTSPMGSASDLTMSGPLSSASNHAAKAFTMHSSLDPFFLTNDNTSPCNEYGELRLSHDVVARHVAVVHLHLAPSMAREMRLIVPGDLFVCWRAWCRCHVSVCRLHCFAVDDFIRQLFFGLHLLDALDECVFEALVDCVPDFHAFTIGHRCNTELTVAFLILFLEVAIDLRMPFAPTPLALILVPLVLRTRALVDRLVLSFAVPLAFVILALVTIALVASAFAFLAFAVHPIQPMSIGVGPDESPDAADRP